MSNRGTRGKWAEGKVREVLDSYTKLADIAYHRFADARAGFRQEAPADFQILQGGRTVLLEVKEVEHTHRLPYNNFPTDQVSRMRLWELAGAKVVVLVATKQVETPYNRKSSRIWRIAPLSLYRERPTEPAEGQTRKVGSWDLSKISPVTLEQALSSLVNLPTRR